MLNDIKLKQVVQTKFLGVTIDEKLSWITRANLILSKISSGTYALNRIKDVKKKKKKKTETKITLLCFDTLPHAIYFKRLGSIDQRANQE